MSLSTVTLNDGNKIPVIGFGTGSSLFEKDATEYVDNALEAGFAHIDTAAVYKNEASVGQAIRQSGLDRADLWVTTKYDGGDILQGIQTSLAKLGLKSVDLYLIHFPRVVSDDFEGAWAQFEKLKKDGLAKSIGVSNFSVKELKTIVDSASITPSVNQIRLHPYNYASYRDLFEYAAQHNIVIEAYGSLAPITTFPGGPVDEVLNTIAARIGGTPAQVIFKWVLAKGAVVVTTTSKTARLKEYLAVVDLPDLTADEIADIEEAGARGMQEMEYMARATLYTLLALSLTLMCVFMILPIVARLLVRWFGLCNSSVA